MDVKHFAFLARQPSASLKPRERFWGMPKRGIALILANAMFWQPMWAQADGIVVSGGGTSLGAAGNGVPIVNIAAPNANGLSHNQYQQYNVGSQGVILNNATAQTQSTQLGGIIIGNSNLQTTGAATTILNEVVTNNRSQLKGYTEVAGQAAKVIIANPYGITCDGCGFINTPQATLTTGKPVLEQGQITRYEVQGGDVSLEGAGLNATNLDQFDIITRSAKVNAELHAKKLNIIAGRNTVDAQTLEATALADDGSVKPELAIDSSALGGMYAGAIRLVGTEQGVGVRLNGEMAASAGDLNIDANGLLTMARTTASGDVTVKAQSVQVNEALHAGGNLDIDANGDLSSQKSMAAAGNVTLTSQGLLSNQGAIEAGINADNTRNTTGDVKIEAKNLRNAGSVVAAGTLGVTAGQAIDNSKGVMGARAGTATITAGGRLDNTEGTLQAATALVVTGADALNVSGNLLGQTVTFTGASLDNTNGLIGASVGAARVTTTGKLDNSGGTLQAETALTVTGADVLNVSGNLLGQTVTFTGTSLDNTNGLIGASIGDARVTVTGKLDNSGGTLQAETGLVVGGAELVNKNGKLSGQTVTVTGTSLDNSQGRINARNGALTVTSSGALDNTEGTLQATTDLVVSGTELVNESGKLLGQTVTVTGTSLDNTKGMIAASTGVTRVTTTGTLDNTEGTLQAATDLTVTGADVLNVSGNLLGQSVTFTGASLDNTGGQIGSSVGKVTVTSTGAVNNNDGTIQAETDLLIGGTALTSQNGKMFGQAVTVTGTSLDNTQGMILARDGKVKVTTDKQINNTKGTLQAKTDLLVSGADVLNISGNLLGQSVTVTGTSLDNSKGLIGAISGEVSVTSTGKINNTDGTLQAETDLLVSGTELVSKNGNMLGQIVTVIGTSLDNTLGQIRATLGMLEVKSSGDVDNSGGRLQAATDLLVDGTEVINSNGRMLGQVSTVTGTSLDNTQGMIAASTGVAKITLDGELDNSKGTLQAGTDLLISGTRALNVSGNLLGETVTFTGTSLDNTKGMIDARNGAATLTGTGRFDNTQGTVLAETDLLVSGTELVNKEGNLMGRAVTLTGTSLDNTQGVMVASDGIAKVTTVKRLDNTLGTIQAGTALLVSGAEVLNISGNLLGQKVTFTGTSFDNSNGLIGATAGEVSVTSTGAVNNSGGTLQAGTGLLVSGTELLNNGGKMLGQVVTVIGSSLDNTLGRIRASLGVLDVKSGGAVVNTGGTLQATTDLLVDGTELVSKNGKMLGETVTVTGTSLDNTQGVIAASKGSAKVTVDEQLDNTQGTLQAGTDLQVNGAKVINASGNMLGQTLTLTGASLDNTGGLIGASTGAATVTSVGRLDNTLGRLLAETTLLVSGSTIVSQRGNMLGRTVTVTGSSIDNTLGLIDARNGAATVTSTGRLDNNGGAIQAATDLAVSGTALVNQGGSLLGQKVTVTGTSLDNSQQGSVIADNGKLTVTVNQALDNSQKGRLQSTVGDMSVTASSLLNRLGVIVGEQVQLTATLDGLDNRGGQVLGNRLVVDVKKGIDNRDSGQLVSGSGGLKLTASELQNQQGSILAGGSLAEIGLGQGRLDNLAGSISAGSVTLNAGDVDNSAGSLTSLSGNLQLTVGRLTNQGGQIEAGQSVLLDAQSLDNSASGRVIAHGGALSRIALQGDLDNRNGRIGIGSQNVTLQTATLFNNGGQIEHAATGLFSLRAASLQGAQGRITGLGSADWNISNVDGTGVWHFNNALDVKGLQSLVLYAGDRLSSVGDLSLKAVSMSNAGELLSDGNLTLELSGNATNQGLISTQKVLNLKAGNLTQNGGRIASAGNAEVNLGGVLDNLGRLTSGSNLSVVADRIDNRGTLGAQQQLNLTASRDINNQADSLIFSGGAMTLRADSLLNRYADIYSQGAFSFAAVDGSRASLLSNQSASIESNSDIDIKVRELNNAKAEFESSQKVASRSIVMNCTDCSGSSHSGYYIIRTVYEGSILKDSAASRLLANRDLLLDTVTVTNGQSLLAANRNATITASNFYNRGYTLDNREENINHFFAGSKSGYRVVEAATNAWNSRNASRPIESQDALPTQVTSLGIESTTNTIRPGNGTAYTGTVQAGGTLALNVSGELINGSLTSQGNAQLTGATLDSSTSGVGQQQIILGTQVGQGPVKDVQRVQAVAADGSQRASAVTVDFSAAATASAVPVAVGEVAGGNVVQVDAKGAPVANVAQVAANTTSASGTPAVRFIPVDFSGAPFVSVDPTALPGFRLPQGEYGLFTPARNPASPYKIETNPTLTDTTRFMSSDYLLGQLGYDTTEASRRLGDGRYETRLIADAVRAQTGQRFLADGLSNDYEQFQYLMDNAIASKDALNLSVGVGLTSEQVAALTHDIVWMEERVIEGETVMTPVLYLAKVDSRDLRGGSLIQGRNVEIITGGDLKNVGTLRASEDLTIVSGGSIYQGGLAEANDKLTMLAQGSIRNAMAGQIRATTVSLTSLTGDIINDRTAVQFQLGAGSTSQVDAGSSISAATQLTLNAANDLTNKGQISSGGDAALTAGNDINLLAVQDRTVTREALRRGMRTEETITQLGSSITAGGNLSLEAGNDLNAVASKASAGKNLTVTAENDVNLASAADEHNIESRYKKGKKKVHEIDNETRQVASEFTAGEDLSIEAGNNATLMASKLKAGDEAYVYAGQNLSLIAAQNSTYTLYDMQKKGSFGSKATRRDEVTDVRNIGSEITTGGDLTLKSGGDQLYQVAKLESGNNLTLESGGAITFEGVKDLHDESHTKSKNSAAWFSSKGKGTTDETLRQTEMAAKGEIAIKAVDGLRIDIKQVDQQSVSQTIDAMVQADPQLAWLKDAEKRGDVDWRQVKEIHESFKYNNSGLGPAAQLVIAILMSFVMGPAGLGMVGVSGAVATSVATTTVTSAINNKGDLGAILKDVTSSDSIKGYVLAGSLAGFVPAIDPTKLGLDLNSVGQVAGKVVAESTIKTAIMGGSFKDNLIGSAIGTGINIAGAVAANKIGDYASINDSGKLTKVAMHAALGGLMAEAMGGDFRTGALAAGANEAVVGFLAEKFLPATGVNKNSAAYEAGASKLLTASQLIGVLAAVATGGDASAAAAVAENGSLYNAMRHFGVDNDGGWSDPTDLFDDDGLPLPPKNSTSELDKVKAQISLAILSGFIPELSVFSKVFGEEGLFARIGAMFSESTEGLEVAGGASGSSGGTLVDSGLSSGEAVSGGKIASEQVTKLSQGEQRAVKKIENILNNFKDSDITGTLRDMAGDPVPKPGGGYWDHMKEMQDTLRGLRNHAETLKGLNEPSAQVARQRALDTINRIESALNGFGI